MIQIPNYTVKKVIGRGGMALVYLAVQDMLSREVALKVLLPDMTKDDNLRKSFLNEGKIVASLDHPNIVSIYDIGVVEDSIFYMTMEYISAGTLKEKLLTKQFSYEEALKILEDIAEGLSYAHGKSYIHRDIKPGNILFRDDGSAVLTDFGIAKLQDTSGDLTRLGLTAGTAQYMSPEQAKSSKLDSRSDIYSLGLVFFEILTGKKAFEFDTHHQAIHLHTTAPPPKLPKEYAFLQTAIDKVLAKKPQNRYQTVLEFVHAIKNTGKSSVTTTGSTMHNDETIIHGAKPSFISRIKQKPFLLSLSLFAGVFTVGAIAFSIINSSNKAIKTDRPIKVTINTIEEKPTQKSKEISVATPQEKPKSNLEISNNKTDAPKCRKKRRGKVYVNGVLISPSTSPSCENEENDRVITETKEQINQGCEKLPSIIRTLLSTTTEEEVVDASKYELYQLATKEAFDSTDNLFCASSSLEYQLKIYKAAIQKGDYKILENFIYPPLKKNKNKNTLKELIKPPYLPNDKVISHDEVTGLSFFKHSKGIYLETKYQIKMVKNLAPSKEALQKTIKKGLLKKAQKKAVRTLKKEFNAANISFKKNTLEATFEIIGSRLAIYELDHGWSVMNHNPKILNKYKDNLPKEIIRYVTRFNW
ncbi:MAG TPA: serine/threonine protein kinase [Leucothrix sp.]|nr:serine/threonine protein kinase [Leucothrix sp.]